MMTESFFYPYSIRFSIATIFVMVLLMLLIFPNVGASNNVMIWIVYGVIALIFLSLISILVTKRLIPALKGNIALELNSDGIVDYIRNISIAWGDIKNVVLVRGRSASTMRIDLKWESDYGSQIVIPLRWVKGKDADIFNTVLSCLEQNKSQ